MPIVSVPISVSETVKVLPNQPGVYQYYDSDGKLLYIGKAKDLKKRVSSYFNNSDSANVKLRALVRKIASIKYVVVNSESDALLLENNLIKQYQPKYNILLKDDKTYPWICIKNEPFPRIITTRHYLRDGSIYFGPYTSGKLLHTLLNMIKELFPIRTCNLQLDCNLIAIGRYKACLENQIGNCLAPCIGEQSSADYQKNIESIKNILKGNFHDVIKNITDEMLSASEILDFERAQILKQQIETLQTYQSKTTIVNTQFKDIEVYTIFTKDTIGIVNMLKVINGAIIQGYTVKVNTQLGETPEEVLAISISEIRSRLNLSSTRLFSNVMPDFQIAGVSYSIPIRGDSKKLLELSLRNCFAYYSELVKRDEAKNPLGRQERVLNTLMKDLNLKLLPVHIECFDNSNLQGTNPVASCVVFKNAKPAKRDYRHFMIKTVVGPDDYASMREVVYRRYHRLVEEGQPLPQLVVIDGGKGQLGAAMESIRELRLDDKIVVIGIAKRLEEIFFAGDAVPIYLDKRSESLKVIQHLRDEAHRFGVRLHTNRRSKAQVKSMLNNIKGIGPKSIEQLFKTFKSIDEIGRANIDDLEKVIGTEKANLVHNFFIK